MEYLRFHFAPLNSYVMVEITMAWLSDLPFSMYEEEDEALNAYMPLSEWKEEMTAEVKAIAKRMGCRVVKTHIPYQNWNAVWEGEFQPISVLDWCMVRGSFHPRAPKKMIDLIIDPKMSFGTGHHETTYLMLLNMRDLPIAGRRVLDFGCGTGVLGILAAKMKAAEVLALDYDPIACENAIENVALNKCSKVVKVVLGELDAVKEGEWGVILANISRQVLLDNMQTLYNLLTYDQGILLVSGILLEDEELITETAEGMGFRIQCRMERNDWACVGWRKSKKD